MFRANQPVLATAPRHLLSMLHTRRATVTLQPDFDSCDEHTALAIHAREGDQMLAPCIGILKNKRLPCFILSVEEIMHTLRCLYSDEL
jgi:hypothetical protein